ncbi:MAG: choice-of-anchor Q domain-containing protein [Actinomycetota bacterium]
MVLRRSIALVVPAAVVAALLLPATPGFAATIAVNCATQDLQPKIDGAAEASTLLISGVCNGNFTVNKGLTLRGNPTATLDGDFAGRVLNVATLATVTLKDLTITDGVAPPETNANGSIARGGGIKNGGGKLDLVRVSVTGNVAAADDTPQVISWGGGIFSNTGSLTLIDSSVTNNLAYSFGSNSTGAAALGGGVLVSNAPLTLTRTVVSSNRTVVRFTQGIGVASGGGLYQGQDSTVTINESRIEGNRSAASGPSAFADAGGLRMNSNTVTLRGLVVVGSRFTGNAAVATGSGSTRAVGGGISSTLRPIAVTDSTLSRNRAAARSSDDRARATGGGIEVDSASVQLTRSGITASVVRAVAPEAHAEGAAIGSFTVFASPPQSSIRVTLSTLSSNSAIANGAAGVTDARGGGISNGLQSTSLVLDRSTVEANHVVSTGIGPSATGGGVDTDGPLSVLRSTLSTNTLDSSGLLGAAAFGGALEVRSSGMNDLVRNSTIASNTVAADSFNGTAEAGGGGIEVALTSETLALSFSTLVRNSVGADGDDNVTHGGGIHATSGVTTLRATVLALNVSPGNPNCSGGSIASGGANLVGALAGCPFDKKGSDKVGVANPKLGTLPANGGPTKTVSLLTGSPALNVIASVSCEVATDQRGVHRPQGPRCDTGAYERKP